MRHRFSSSGKSSTLAFASAAAVSLVAWCITASAQTNNVSVAGTSARLPSLSSVRLLPGPFADGIKANREYLLALERDRLLAPLWREAGLERRANPYRNWESSGLDGYSIPAKILGAATNGRVTIKFSAKQGSGVGAGGVYDVRLMKSDVP